MNRLVALAASVALALAAMAPSASAQVVPQRQVQTFRYDDLGRLTRATYDGATTVSFAYAADGSVSSQKVTPKPPSSGGGGGGGGGCFIATAAYGSALQPEVQALREFRDAHLRTNGPGRAFVAWYERSSPPLAAWIGERPWARATARVALAPLLLVVGHPLAAAIATPLLAAALFVAWRRRRLLRRAARAAAAVSRAPSP